MAAAARLERGRRESKHSVKQRETVAAAAKASAAKAATAAAECDRATAASEAARVRRVAAALWPTAASGSDPAGKTAAESSDVPNLDVNHTRCKAADARWGALPPPPAQQDTKGDDDAAPWLDAEWADSAGVAYDVTKVPGAREESAELREEL